MFWKMLRKSVDKHQTKEVKQHIHCNRANCLVQCQQPSGNLEIKIHHTILHALDPSNERFEYPQKFTAYVGYVNRTTKRFTRPEDHCYEVKELFDEDGDCLIAVCKTDVDHMLGFHCNNVLCLWRCNHQANQWLHQSCKRGNEWFHPYHKATYEKENRGNPPYFDSLPPTLTPTTKPKLQKLLTKEEFITALESLPTKDRHTKAAMAKALEISTTTLCDKAKAFELILNNYTILTKPKLTKEVLR